MSRTYRKSGAFPLGEMVGPLKLDSELGTLVPIIDVECLQRCCMCATFVVGLRRVFYGT